MSSSVSDLALNVSSALVLVRSRMVSFTHRCRFNRLHRLHRFRRLAEHYRHESVIELDGTIFAYFAPAGPGAAMAVP